MGERDEAQVKRIDQCTMNEIVPLGKDVRSFVDIVSNDHDRKLTPGTLVERIDRITMSSLRIQPTRSGLGIIIGVGIYYTVYWSTLPYNQIQIQTLKKKIQQITNQLG